MNLLSYVGNTPMIKVDHLPDNYATVYVKLEQYNPGGSIKTRVALRMIEDAENAGILTPGATVIEATGGNTGIGLALICNVKGYKFLAVVPDNYSKERIQKLKVFGAEVILSDSNKGNDSHIKLVEKMCRRNPKYIWLNQFRNESSVKAHYYGTGPEIYHTIKPDAFVACVGSAGTFQGIGSYLKENKPDTLLVVVQPIGCSLEKGISIKHKIQGVSLGIRPPILDYTLIDDYIDVDYNDIQGLLISLMKSEGLFLGISSGANLLAAINIAKKLGPGKSVCTVAPDGGENYIEEYVEWMNKESMEG